MKLKGGLNVATGIVSLVEMEAAPGATTFMCDRDGCDRDSCDCDSCDRCDWCEGSGCEGGHCDREG